MDKARCVLLGEPNLYILIWDYIILMVPLLFAESIVVATIVYQVVG